MLKHSRSEQPHCRPFRLNSQFNNPLNRQHLPILS
jgi:hypothetical protein